MNTNLTITLAAAMMAVAATPASAEENAEWFPLDIEATVTSIEREHGTFVDRWTFSVQVTNYSHETILVNVWGTNTETDHYLNECALENGMKIRTGQTRTLTACYTVDESEHPEDLVIYGWTGVDRLALLPFVHDACYYYEDATCLSLQNIDGLIENVEPVQCVAPPSTPADDAPTTGTAVHHIHLNDVILTFNVPVTLADGWHDNMSIFATNGTDNIVLDGLRSTTRNLMGDDSTLVWLSLAYSDYQQLDDATALTLTIDPGTIMYGDGQTLGTRLNVPVDLVP